MTRPLPLFEDLWTDGPAARRLRLVVLAAATALAAHGLPSEPAPIALLAAASGAGLVWTLLAPGDRLTLACLLVLAGAGASLATAASSERDDAAAALIFATVAAGGAAQRFGFRPALAVAAVATAALLADAPHSPAVVVFAALVIPATLAAGVARRQYVERTELAEQLLAEAQRSREEQARAATLDERVRVAREVHDVLAHSLTALAISLETAEALLDERADLAGGLAQVRRARGLAVEGLAETRGAVAALRGTIEPLPDSVGRLLADYRADMAAEATLVTTGEPRALAAEPALALGRIAQEAMTNVRRHAPGAAVHAALDYAPASVRLSIRNELTASATRAGSGYGLQGMRERADACGGRLDAGAADGGWHVDAELPA